jgi:hypothetical protein
LNAAKIAKKLSAFEVNWCHHKDLQVTNLSTLEQTWKELKK